MILLKNILRKFYSGPVNNRTFKNFGHKRQPVQVLEVLWHGFLTFTFIGLCIDWKQIAKYFFPDKEQQREANVDGDLT